MKPLTPQKLRALQALIVATGPEFSEAVKDQKMYKFTQQQEKVFFELQKAIDRCVKNDIYLWVDYGSISGVNGKVVHFIAPDATLGEQIDDTQVVRIDGLDLLSNADDKLFVQRR